jgi:nitrilase
MRDKIDVALAQISPVWLNREATTEKIIGSINKAADSGCDIVIFGESLLPGYPFWVQNTGGAQFNSDIQKEIFSHYLSNGVDIEAGHLDSIKECCKKGKISAVIGVAERASDRGGHTIYCSLVYIDSTGTITNIHRKVMPTYEERLVWGQGDGYGLRVNKLENFTIGALNCWENWLPLVRASLYGLGEDLHIAIWPGSVRNTVDITRFIALESRSFVVSVSSILSKVDIPKDIPYYDLILNNSPDIMADGGSCVAAPDGTWLLEPVEESEGLFIVTIDHNQVRRERQNLDTAGHYSRPEITNLVVDRTRQKTVRFID